MKRMILAAALMIAASGARAQSNVGSWSIPNGAKVEVGLEESFHAVGLKADVKSFVLSIPVGVSYEFSSLVLDARYNLGISKAASAEGESTKHNVFQFTVGYKFSL